MPTREAFVEAYRSQLVARYAWAKDEAQLARFMERVHATLFAGRHTWIASGEAFDAACEAVGLKRKASIKALRALPAE